MLISERALLGFLWLAIAFCAVTSVMAVLGGAWQVGVLQAGIGFYIWRRIR